MQAAAPALVTLAVARGEGRVVEREEGTAPATVRHSVEGKVAAMVAAMD